MVRFNRITINVFLLFTALSLSSTLCQDVQVDSTLIEEEQAREELVEEVRLEEEDARQAAEKANFVSQLRYHAIIEGSLAKNSAKRNIQKCV